MGFLKRIFRRTPYYYNCTISAPIVKISAEKAKELGVEPGQVTVVVSDAPMEEVQMKNFTVETFEKEPKQFTVKAKKRGGRWWALCPLHDEKTPSFCITGDSGYCFGCHQSLRVIKEENADTKRRVNMDAELATLGAMLLDPEAVVTVKEYLTPLDFGDHGNRAVYSAILELHKRNQQIDMIGVAEELKARGRLEEVGGISFVSKLTSAVPTSANVRYYAECVLECSDERKK